MRPWITTPTLAFHSAQAERDSPPITPASVDLTWTVFSCCWTTFLSLSPCLFHPQKKQNKKRSPRLIPVSHSPQIQWRWLRRGERKKMEGRWRDGGRLSARAISKKVRDYDPYFYTSGTDEEKDWEGGKSRESLMEGRFKKPVFEIFKAA